jgi:hypothetical protein
LEVRFHIKYRLISLHTFIVNVNQSVCQKPHPLIHELNLLHILLAGDVVLNRLVLKQSALDELDLSVKTVAGHIGKSHCFSALNFFLEVI